MNGCATRKRSGLAIPAASAVGRRPEVDDAISTPGAAAAQASASSACLSSVRSGALSCTSTTSCAAAAGVATTVNAPSGGSSGAERLPERPACVEEHLAELAPGFGIGVVEQHVVTGQQEARRPPATDDTSAEEADAAHVSSSAISWAVRSAARPSAGRRAGVTRRLGPQMLTIATGRWPVSKTAAETPFE